MGLQLSSIAFPAIGAGVARFSLDEVAARMAEVIAEELSARTGPVHVEIFLLDRYGRMTEMDFIRFFEEFSARAPRVANKVTLAASSPPVTQQSFLDLAAETQEEYKRKRIHNLRRLLVGLEDQRGRLEEMLISLLGSNKLPEEQAVRKSLLENQELRLQYLNELQSYAAQSADTPPTSRGNGPLCVFLSSTSSDLTAHRTAVKDTIARCDLFFRGMEHFGAEANGSPPAKLIVEEVRKADVYVGLFGVRYGSLDPATGLSMTELEFREAEAEKKRMLLYVMHQDASVMAAHIESDAEGLRKLAALKAHILKQYVPYLFKSVDDLARQSQIDLGKLKAGP